MNSNKSTENSRTTLIRALGRTDVIAIGFGTMVGWSWIMMAATWITEAGILGAVIAFLLGGGIILSIGMIYGELTAALPLAGGEFVFAYRAFGKKTAWLTGWIMALAYLGVAAWESIALATAVNYILPIPMSYPLVEIAGYQVYFSWAVVGSAGAFVITILNYFGAKPVLLFQVMATAAILIMAIVIFLGGVTLGDFGNLGAPFGSRGGFFYVFLMVPAMLIGFEVIPQSAEEMNISPKDIGKMIIVCILMSLIWYFLITIGICLAAPVEIRTSGIIPIADIAAYLFKSEVFSIVIVFGGILGIMTTWNGFFLGATRLLFAMGRAGVIPEIFGKVHKKYKTPWAAILLVGLVCMISPFFGRNALVWFINTSSLCALAAYCLVIVSFLVLRKKDVELLRPFEVKKGVLFGYCVLIITVVYLVFYILFNFSTEGINPGFIITAIWVAFGAVMAIGVNVFGKKFSDEDMEVRIFGERFARKAGVNAKEKH